MFIRPCVPIFHPTNAQMDRKLVYLNNQVIPSNIWIFIQILMTHHDLKQIGKNVIFPSMF